MSASRTLKIDIIGDSKSAEQAFANVEQSGGKMSGALGKVGKVAGAALVGIGVAAVGAGAISLKSFIGFEKQMNEVFTLLPGISQDAMDDMTAQVQDFSKEFGTLPQDVVPALYNSLSAGVPPDNVFAFLETAQKAAVGGVTDLNTAVDAISTVVNAFGDDVIDATEASDLMFTAVRLGKTTFDEIGGAISNVAPVAAAMGVEFGDVTAALAALTAQGVPTSVATTQVRGVLSELGKEGTKVAKIFGEEAGIGFQEFIANGGNMQEALQVLEQYANDNNLSMIDLFGSIEAGQAALALTGKGTEAFSDALDEMQNSAGATETAYETMDKGLQRNLDKIRANFEVLKLEVGSRLAPVFARFTDFVLTTMLPGLVTLAGTIQDKLRPAFEFLTGIAGRLQGAFVDGGFMGVLRELPGIFAGIGGSILSALGSIDWGGIASGIVDGLLNGLRAVTGFAGDLATWLWDTVKAINYQGIGESIVSGLLSGVTAVGNFAVDIGSWLWDTFTGIEWLNIGQSIVDGLIAGVRAVGSFAADIGSWLWDTFTSVEWGAIGQSLVDGLMTGFNAVTDFGSRFISWMQAGIQGGDWSGIGQTINEKLSGAMEGIANLGPVESLIDLFNTRLLPVLQTVADEVGSRVTPTINSFRASIGQAAANISTNLGPTLDNLRGLWVSLQPAISAIVPVLQVIATIVGGVLIAAFNGLIGLLGGVLPNVVNIVFALINGLIGILTGLVETVTGVVKVIKGLLTGDWALAWEGAKQVVFGMVHAITSLFEGLWGVLKGAIMAVVDGVIGLFTGLKNTLVGNSIIPDMINGIITWFARLPGELIAMMAGFVSSIIGFFVDLMTEGIAKAGELVSGVITAFTDLFVRGPKVIFDTYIAIVNELTKMVTEGIKKAAEFVTGLLDEIVSLVTEAPGVIIDMAAGIASEMADLIGKAKQWGIDFVGGLIGGLTEKLGELKDAAGKVTGAITDGLGKLPGLSPSPLGIEIGQQFGDGLVEGLEDSIPRVELSAAEIAAAVVEGVKRDVERLPELLYDTGVAFALEVDKMRVAAEEALLLARLRGDSEEEIANLQADLDRLTMILEAWSADTGNTMADAYQFAFGIEQREKALAEQQAMLEEQHAQATAMYQELMNDLEGIATGETAERIGEELAELLGLQRLAEEVGRTDLAALYGEQIAKKRAELEVVGELMATPMVQGMVKTFEDDKALSEATKKLGKDAIAEMKAIFSEAPELAEEFIDDIALGLKDGSIDVEDAMELLADIPRRELIPALEEISETYRRQIVQAIIDGNMDLVASLKLTRSEIDTLAASMDDGAQSASKYVAEVTKAKAAGPKSSSSSTGDAQPFSGGSSDFTNNPAVAAMVKQFFPETWAKHIQQQQQRAKNIDPMAGRAIQNNITVNVDGEPVAQSVNKVNTNTLAVNMGPI